MLRANGKCKICLFSLLVISVSRLWIFPTDHLIIFAAGPLDDFPSFVNKVSTSPVSDELHIQQIEQPFDKISENRGRIARNMEWSKTKPVPPTWAEPSGTATLRTTNVSRETIERHPSHFASGYKEPVLVQESKVQRISDVIHRGNSET